MFLFRAKRAATKASPSGAYGPHPGVQALTLDDLLARYQVQFEAVCQIVGLPRQIEYRVLRPILRRYATYVHLLPASESNHHAEPGGLLFHGYEVAQMAVQAAEGIYFTVPNQPPSARKRMEPRWRVALVIAALAHDLGKPIADLIVVADGVEAPWNPLGQSLMAWLATNELTYYHYMWKRARGEAHKASGMWLLDPLIGESKEWLCEVGYDCMRAILSFVSGTEESPLTEIINTADRDSANRSLQGPHTAAAQDTGYVPIKSKLAEAMRNAVQARLWRVNVPNGHVYVGNRRAWLTWPNCAEAIITYLYEAGTPGLSKDPSRIATLIAETGVGVPAEPYAGASSPYWTIRPVGVQVGKRGLLALQVPASVLFDVPPAEFAVHVEGETNTATPTTTGAEPVANTAAATPEMQTESPTPESTAPTGSNPSNNGTQGQKKTNDAKDSHEESEASTPESARAWLEEHGGSVGAHLGELARQVRAGFTQVGWGATLLYHEGEVWIAVPEGAPPSVKTGAFGKQLENLVWVEFDHNTGMRIVQSLDNGRRAIRLKKQISEVLCNAAGGPPARDVIDAPQNSVEASEGGENASETPQPEPGRQLLERLATGDAPSHLQAAIGNDTVKVPERALGWFLKQDAAASDLSQAGLRKSLAKQGCRIVAPNLVIPKALWNQLQRNTG